MPSRGQEKAGCLEMPVTCPPQSLLLLTPQPAAQERIQAAPEEDAG